MRPVAAYVLIIFTVVRPDVRTMMQDKARNEQWWLTKWVLQRKHFSLNFMIQTIVLNVKFTFNANT